MRRLDVQVDDIERVSLDVVPARLDAIAHQDGEDRVRCNRIVKFDPIELPVYRVAAHRNFVACAYAFQENS